MKKDLILTGSFRRISAVMAVAVLSCGGADAYCESSVATNATQSVTATAVCMAATGGVQWEMTGSADATDGDDSRVTVTTRGGCIYVTVREPSQVRIYTILGQEVARRTLQPGTWRLRMPSRGIFLLKADGVTRRITV